MLSGSSSAIVYDDYVSFLLLQTRRRQDATLARRAFAVALMADPAILLHGFCHICTLQIVGSNILRLVRASIQRTGWASTFRIAG